MSERVIPEDLRGAYIEAQMGYNPMPGEVKSYIERIADLTAEVERLKAPVSDEEWQDFGIPFSGVFDKIDRDGINRIIEARAKETK